MSKPFLLAMIGLVAFCGSFRHSSSVDEPVKAKKQNDFRKAWFQNHLSAMREPSLWKLAETDATATVYRFLWLPTFHNAISVRFVKSEEGAVLNAVRLGGESGFEAGNIVARKSD